MTVSHSFSGLFYELHGWLSHAISLSVAVLGHPRKGRWGVSLLKDHRVMLQENLKDHLSVSSDSDAWHLLLCPLPLPSPQRFRRACKLQGAE